MVSAGHVLMSELEIGARCRRLGLPRPPTLPNAGPDDEAVEADRAGATWVPDLLTTLAKPSVAIFAHRQETGAVVEMMVWAVSPSWAAEQVAERNSVYSLSLFPAHDALDRIGAFCGLPERSAPDVGVCELSGRGFLKAAEQARADPERARRTLRADGLGANAAEALAGALAGCERRVQVTVVRRFGAGRLEGRTVAWVDGGAGGGLWRVEAPMLATSGDFGDYGDALLDKAIMTISPATRTSLLDEIIQGIPPDVRSAMR